MRIARRCSRYFIIFYLRSQISKINSIDDKKQTCFPVDFSQPLGKLAEVPTLGEAPSKRTDHSVVLFRDSLLVFGGFDGHNRRAGRGP